MYQSIEVGEKLTTNNLFSDVFSVSPFRFEHLRGRASAFSRDSFQHVAGKNAGAGKLCALLHEIENGVFPLAADDGQAA
jgi:hypothetical protein